MHERAPDRFSLTLRWSLDGFGHVMMGALRTLADDYGALVLLDHQDTEDGREMIDITLIEAGFAEGRDFDLGARAG